MDLQTLAVALALGNKRAGAAGRMIAAAYSSSSTYAVDDLCMHSEKLYRCTAAITTPEPFNIGHWEETSVDAVLSTFDSQTTAAIADLNDSIEAVADNLQTLEDDLQTLEGIVDVLYTKPRFGVKGIGGSGSTLTRLWDAVGKSATPGTNTIAAVSDFDSYAPFNRRKCVGSWTAQNGKARFEPKAYYGDADYAEDGTMGDYVAVEVAPFYYCEDGDTIGVSEQWYPGWKIHPVCLDLDGNIRMRTYLPCYALALNANGDAVSLPGLYNCNGSYKSLWDNAKTYADANAASLAILEPSAVDHYEWLLETIEFATQNMSNVMTGAASMPMSDSCLIVATPAANQVVLAKANGANFVLGQTIGITNNIWDNPATGALNKVTAIHRCDATGAASDAGDYYCLTYDGTDRTANITLNSTKCVSRAWMTGACTGYIPEVPAVNGHTGSPVSKTNNRYPCMYRWRENAWANQFMTCLDLMDVRVDEGNEAYHLDWYFLADPRKYTPSSTSKPDLTDLTNPESGWVKLDVVTPSESYVNGYVRELGFDVQYPWAKVPVNTVGASTTTYYCDYAALVNSNVVRAVRRRGYLSNGANCGPRYFYASNAPAFASWHCGGALYFIQ